jgi:lysophospholipase L1-like esterase
MKTLNTHGPLDWATIMRTHNDFEATLATDADQNLLSQYGHWLEVESLRAANRLTAPLAEPLPNEFFLHGTSYVVLPPAEDDTLAAVASAIRELSATDVSAPAAFYGQKAELARDNTVKATDALLREMGAIPPCSWNNDEFVTEAARALAKAIQKELALTSFSAFLDNVLRNDLARKFEQTFAQAGQHGAV